MIPLTDKEINFYERQKVCHICKKELCTNENNENEFKLNIKVRDHCHYTGIFHNGSTYDYHFIIKQLAEEFKGQFECLGENTEKYIIFSVPFEKERDNGKTSTQFIDS